jgi:hypothetical protein
MYRDFYGISPRGLLSRKPQTQGLVKVILASIDLGLNTSSRYELREPRGLTCCVLCMEGEEEGKGKGKGKRTKGNIQYETVVTCCMSCILRELRDTDVYSSRGY